MRTGLLALVIALYCSCNKIDEIKVDNVFKKDSVVNETGREKLTEEGSLKRISTSEASINIGKKVTLTGYIAEVNIRNKVAYLNFDSKYPKNTFTGVVFASDFKKFDDLEVFKNKKVELTGVVSEYNKKPQIIINSPEQIKIIK